MHLARLLLIEDDHSYANLIQKFLSKKGFEVENYYAGKEALSVLKKQSFDLVLSDFRLPDMTGMEILEWVKTEYPHIPVVLITGYSDIRTAVKSMKMGAFEYISKPINPDELLAAIESALQNSKDSENESEAKGRKPSEGFIAGKSPSAQSIQEQVALVAPTDMSVIIMGESGTGKEYISRQIHSLSNRAQHPFVALDCGAISPELAGSEMFGHKKGAFTGALQNKTGQFQEAHQGTLFLDEIGNLPYEVQVKLLRAIQERKIRPLGSNQDIEVDVRIIVATNEALPEVIKTGHFREDLYHRLNEFSMVIPPLRERPEDIIHYAQHFLKLANTQLGKEIKNIGEEAMEYITRYPWPGNLRELKNVVKRAVLLCKGEQIELACLPAELKVNPESFPKEDSRLAQNESNLKKIQAETEKELIIRTLEKVKYNKSKAARLLNIDRKTLYNKMEKYQIDF